MTFNKLIFISFIVLLELNYQFVTAVLPVILSNQLEWQDFNCNKSYECLNSTKLKLWVYHSKDYDQKYFYFFYEAKVIRFEIPRMYRDYSQSDYSKRNYFLVSRPKYIRYSSLNHKLTFLDENDVIGLLNTYELNSENIETYLIKKSETSNPVIKNLELSDDLNRFAHLDTKNNQSLAHRIQNKDTSSFTIIHNDPTKWLEIVYGAFELTFNFYKPDLDPLGGDRKELDYDTVKAIYYEYMHKSFPFDAYLAEIDTFNQIHFNQYEFQKTENLNARLKQTVSFNFYEFLGCKDETKLNPSSVKGILIREQSTYIFVNDYYIKIKQDMTKTNFFVDKSNELDNEFRGRVEIEKDDDHQNDWIELNNFKYVKELNDEIFMTYNHRYTHKLNILNKDEPTELLKATETEYPVQLHRCVNQVLVISNQIFCFQGKSYYHMCDKNDDKKACPLYSNGEEIPISHLFSGSEVRYDYEDLLYIFRSHNNSKIVFMTRSWLLLFDPSIFEVNNKNLQLTARFRMPQALYQKQVNCLFFKRSECFNSVNANSFTNSETVTTVQDQSSNSETLKVNDTSSKDTTYTEVFEDIFNSRSHDSVSNEQNDYQFNDYFSRKINEKMRDIFPILQGVLSFLILSFILFLVFISYRRSTPSNVEQAPVLNSNNRPKLDKPDSSQIDLMRSMNSSLVNSKLSEVHSDVNNSNISQISNRDNRSNQNYLKTNLTQQDASEKSFSANITKKKDKNYDL